MINREYKDSWFSFIFSREENREWTLSFYNAVNVRMLNIHSDRNRAIMKRCRPLYEYASFTDNVYKYRESMEIESAVNQALDEMPDDWLIKGFLSANRAEVVEMCLTEYNEEETMEMFKEEGRKEGREEGVQAVIKTCKSLGASSLDAVEKIVATMGYSQSEADSLVSKYW